MEFGEDGHLRTENRGGVCTNQDCCDVIYICTTPRGSRDTSTTSDVVLCESSVSRVQIGSGPVFCDILLLVRERRESVVGNTQGSSYKNTGSCETQMRSGVDGPERLGRDSEHDAFVCG